MRTLKVEVPEKLKPLMGRARYKGAHGGRGGAKSHFFAEQLILRCFVETTRAVCIREVQNSLKESVRQLLVDKIAKLELQWFFEVLETEIRGKNGSLIIFRGMQAYNADNIKSLEGYDVAWVEEAQSLSEVSLRMLRPTIRKPGSEMWFSWNPRHDTDAIDQFLRGSHPPDDAIVVEVNWQDNPWFPNELLAEKDRDFAADAEMADHVWGGGYQIVSEGAYYAKLLAQAEKDGRIGHYPYRLGQTVTTAWDIGIHDYMTCWFIVDDGLIPTVVDYYEASGEGFDEFISHCIPELFLPPDMDSRFKGWTMDRALKELSREVPFRYGKHYLPHDVRAREVGAGGRHRFQTLQALGLRTITKGVPNGSEERVAATRELLPTVRFHKCPRVEKGIKRLRNYSRKRNDAMGTYTTPLHDENSHGADAFGEYAINYRIELPKPLPPPKRPEELGFEVNPITRSIQSNMNVREIVEMKDRLAKIGRKKGLQL